METLGRTSWSTRRGFLPRGSTCRTIREDGGMSRRPALRFEVSWAFARPRCHCVKYRIQWWHNEVNWALDDKAKQSSTQMFLAPRWMQNPPPLASLLHHPPARLPCRPGRVSETRRPETCRPVDIRLIHQAAALSLHCVCVCPETRGLGWPCRSTMITCCGATEGEAMGRNWRQQCFPTVRSSVPSPALISRHHTAPIWWRAVG